MTDRSLPCPARLASLLLVVLLLATTAGCSVAPTQQPPGQPPTPGSSVQDQLAQLAAQAAPAASATALAATGPAATAPLLQGTPTAEPPASPAAAARPARTRRPTATPTVAARPTKRPAAATATVAGSRPTRSPRATATPSDGLPTISQAKLPREARDTIRLIQQGGPFPYDKDGATFGNREGLLPKRANGYYQEYTVITPGSRDRGARRIIAGQGGELYYTDDHYDSFKRVTP